MKELASVPSFKVIARSMTTPWLDHTLVVVTEAPFIYVDTERDIQVTVPVGFVSDWASVPNDGYIALESNALDLSGAGLPHDYLYSSDAQVMVASTGVLRPVEKHEADSLLYEWVQFFGGSKEDAEKIWLAVHLFAGSHWRQKPASWRPDVKLPAWVPEFAKAA